MKKEVIVLDTFDGHLVLLAKDWYRGKDDFFESVCRLWGVRCGWPEGKKDNRVLEVIADKMVEILHRCEPNRIPYLHQIIHREVTRHGSFIKPKGLSPIEVLIWEYRSLLMGIEIQEKIDGKWYKLVSLPKPQKQIMKRICNGNGRYEDYEKLIEKDKR